MTSTRGTSQTRAVVAHYDERASSYDESSMHRGLVGAIAELEELAGARDVLDVGTGTGLMLRALAARADARPDARLIGIDLSPGMLSVARRELPRATLVLADAGSIPVADDSVDAITCVTALHLFEDPHAVFAEWARVLRPGGLVVTATFVPDGDIDSRPHRAGFVRRHAAYRSLSLLSQELQPFGFSPLGEVAWTDGTDRLLICLMRRT